MCDMVAVATMARCHFCGRNVDTPCYHTSNPCETLRAIGKKHAADIYATTPPGADIHEVLELLATTG